MHQSLGLPSMISWRSVSYDMSDTPCSWRRGSREREWEREWEREGGGGGGVDIIQIMVLLVANM